MRSISLCCGFSTPYLQGAPFGGIEHQESAKDPLTVCWHIEGHAVLSPQHALPQLLLATYTTCYTFRIQQARKKRRQSQNQVPVPNTHFKNAMRGNQQSWHTSESFKAGIEILTFPTHFFFTTYSTVHTRMFHLSKVFWWDKSDWFKCVLQGNVNPQVAHCRQYAGVRSNMRGVKRTFVSTLWQSSRGWLIAICWILNKNAFFLALSPTSR